MVFGEIFHAGYSGQSRAGKMAPSCPLGQPIPARDLVHLARSRSKPYNKLGYLSADIICSEQQTVFRERSSRKTVSYEEQIMSKDKYPSIFSPQLEAIVFIILQIFYTTHAVLKIGEYSRKFPSFSWGMFAHVTRLDQSRASENI